MLKETRSGPCRQLGGLGVAAGMAGPSGARWEARERQGSSGNREVAYAVDRVGGDVGEEGGGRRCGLRYPPSLAANALEALNSH